MQFKNEKGELVGEITAIARYFRQPTESLADFQNQVKALTPEAKTELAVGAAKELGWEQV